MVVAPAITSDLEASMRIGWLRRSLIAVITLSGLAALPLGASILDDQPQAVNTLPGNQQVEVRGVIEFIVTTAGRDDGKATLALKVTGKNGLTRFAVGPSVRVGDSPFR